MELGKLKQAKREALNTKQWFVFIFGARCGDFGEQMDRPVNFDASPLRPNPSSPPDRIP